MPHLRPYALAALGALLALAAGACVENIPRQSLAVASIAVAPATCELMQGDTLTLTATARNVSHVLIPDAPLGWASSDLGVVAVDLEGTIRGVGPGTATVYATTGTVSGKAVVTVIPRMVALRITPDDIILVPGGSFAFVADAIGTSGGVIARRAPVWSSSDTTVLRVGTDGVATAVGVGAAFVVAHDEALADSVLVRAVTVRFRAASAGPYQNTCAAGPQGAWCWGYDGNAGNLGAGVGLDLATAPVRVVGGSRFVSVAAGDAYTCALTADGIASCWGDASFGRLGDGTTASRATPAPVAGGLTLEALSAGRRHVCGLTAAGRVWCWGGNNRGQLGVPLTTGLSEVPVPVATEALFTAVGAGHMHTCGLATDSLILCWGRGTELGDSVGVNRYQPAPVAGGHKFRSLSVGWTHACGIATDGQVWCWGYNLGGELGTQADSLVTIPAAVQNAPALASVTAGYYATCGLTTDGHAWCWGLNNAGQLGTGDTLGGPVPRPVAGGHLFTTLSIGYAHSCGMATDGLLYCWGASLNGMLGDGSETGGHLTPWPVTGQTVPSGAERARGTRALSQTNGRRR